MNKDSWKKFEQNNKEIVLNILFVPNNEKEIRHAYISKYNHHPKNQVILLMMVKNGIILLQEVCLHYLEEYHQVIMEIFTV